MNLDLFGNVIVETEEEVESKIPKASPFAFLKEISDKVRLPGIDGYNAWIINNTLSMRKDNVFYANEMNKYSHLAPEVQREFYYHAIRKGNYHAKYAKAGKEEFAPAIAEYFKCSPNKVKEYLRYLTPEQIQIVVDKVEHAKGGKR